MQLTEEVRHQMEWTLKFVYGVNLDNSWNRVVTDSWDKAQTQVRRIARDVLHMTDTYIHTQF